MQTISHEVGRRIRMYRLRQGMTQETLAEKSELYHTYIGQVERGEKNLTLASCEKILTALGVTFSELFENIEECKSSESIPAQCFQLICSKSQDEQLHLYRILLEIDQIMNA